MADLGYEETVQLLRGVLAHVRANARAFHVRSRGRPELLGARQWAELADIEQLAAEALSEALVRELRVEPSGPWLDLQASFGGLLGGLIGERRLLQGVKRRCDAQPVDEWRSGAPQLESSLWPFFCDRTHHLANAVALGLSEPAPYPALVWQPHRRAFSR